MKKLILLSLLGLFFLAGCGNKIIYLDPETTITIGTGTTLADFGTTVKNEISRTASEEEKQNGRKESTVSGYLYTYTYSDLGIKIMTPALYDPYFFEKTDTPIFKRYKNIIYNAHLGNNIWVDYIGFFTKNSNISFENEVQKNHLPTGCKISTGIFDKQTTRFDSMIGFEVIYFEDSTQGTRCTIDKEFPQREMPIMFVMDPKKPNIYYKLGIQDGCAPGPCTIFGNIEFF